VWRPLGQQDNDAEDGESEEEEESDAKEERSGRGRPKNENYSDEDYGKTYGSKWDASRWICPTALKKTRMCPNLMQRGYCEKERCNFAHSEEELQPRPDLKKTRLCKFWQQGKCPYERDCKFAHGEDELQDGQGGEDEDSTGNRDEGKDAQQTGTSFRKTRPCRYWLKGHCQYGDSCRFAHGDEELEEEEEEDENGAARTQRGSEYRKTKLCRHWMTGSCPFEDSCKFAHGEHELQLHSSWEELVASCAQEEQERKQQEESSAPMRPRPDLTRTALCKFYNRGICPYGVGCRFAHGEHELLPWPEQNGTSYICPPAPTEEPPPRPDLTKTQLCKYYMRGTCPLDSSSCRFAHGEHELRPWQDLGPTATARRRPEAPQTSSSWYQRYEEPESYGRRGRSLPPAPRAKAPSPKRALHEVLQRAPWRNKEDDWGKRSYSYWEVSEHARAGERRNSGREAPAAAPPPVQRSGRPAMAPPPSSPPPAPPEDMVLEDFLADAMDTSEVQGHTLMVLNIPTFLTQGALLSLFEDLSAKLVKEVDFFHVPWNMDDECNFSYAILNFASRPSAERFKAQWHCKHLLKDTSSATLRVVPGILQGFSANVRHFMGPGGSTSTPAGQKFQPMLREVTQRQVMPLSSISARRAPGSSQSSLAPHPPSLNGSTNIHLPGERTYQPFVESAKSSDSGWQ